MCPARNECDNVATELRKAGLQAAAYHAGLDDNVRAMVQEKWLNDDNCKVLKQHHCPSLPLHSYIHVHVLVIATVTVLWCSCTLFYIYFFAYLKSYTVIAVISHFIHCYDHFFSQVINCYDHFYINFYISSASDHLCNYSLWYGYWQSWRKIRHPLLFTQVSGGILPGGWESWSGWHTLLLHPLLHLPRCQEITEDHRKY